MSIHWFKELSEKKHVPRTEPSDNDRE